jgi:MFS-type transporter involved in bile tolerance (Atg22 family)
MDALNILAAGIVSNVLAVLGLWFAGRLAVEHVLMIPAATGMIAMFYYVAMGGQIDVLKDKVLRRG